ncbi:hypothetical protein MN116_000661 [Schistosoma mekongi]|uniref:Rap guanine nucleotide exchange factor 4 n=1 Tax=Schistosoma mekongi TaxID=38744 RepID=A0AAE1ZLJ9_SCHME|nr:hypothetical protein MN116_000661 [Schistosoma mekongi]
MEVIRSQLFDRTTSIQSIESEKLPCITECQLSIPTIYKAKITPDWIKTICTEIWTRLLSSRQLDITINQQTSNSISGSELINYLMHTEHKTDRNLICGIWQLLLDEKAIESITLLHNNNNNNNNNNDVIYNPNEFYDRNDVFYVCCHLNEKHLSINEVLTNSTIYSNPIDCNQCITSCSTNQVTMHNELIQCNAYDDGYHVLINRLYHLAPEALFRKILQKLPLYRTDNELDYIYHELLLIPALSTFSISVKKELCKCLQYEIHENALNIVFQQGDPGYSWYIIYHGSVWVHVNGQGYVCRLYEGDDFENTVRLKKNNSNILILERIPNINLNLSTNHNVVLRNQFNTSFNYIIRAGTIHHILYYLIDSHLNDYDKQLNSLLNETLFPPYLCPHTPYNLNQIWQNFFLTYTLFTNNNEILLFLYEYLGGDKKYLVTMPKSTLNNNNNNNNENIENNIDLHTIDYQWDCLNNIQFDIMKVNRVIVFIYIWRYCLGLVKFIEQINVNQFILALITALHNFSNCLTMNNNNNLVAKTDITLQLNILCLNKIIKFNEKFMINKSINRKQSIIQPNFLHFSYNFLRTLPFVYSNKRNIIPSTLPLIQSIHKVTFKIYITELNKQITMTTSIESSVYDIKKQLILTNELIQNDINELCIVEVYSKGDYHVYHDNDYATIISCCHVKLAICIHPLELLDYVINTKHKSNTCPHIRTLIKRFSILHAWTITQIITTFNITKRVNLIQKLIKLSYRLITSPLNDFYSSFAILLGLQNSSITRLTNTWERVSNRSKRLLNNYLLPLIDPAKNHRTARLWNNNQYTTTNNNNNNNNVINTPKLPFLALILKDLRFGEDANQTDYQQSIDGENLINFEKMQLISDCLRLWINSISSYELLHPYNQLINNDRNKLITSSIMNTTVQKLLDISIDLQLFVLQNINDYIDDPITINQLSLKIQPK